VVVKFKAYILLFNKVILLPSPTHTTHSHPQTMPAITTKTGVKPKQQPSRKGKKAWRKNVDITGIEKQLEDITEQIRLG